MRVSRLGERAGRGHVEDAGGAVDGGLDGAGVKEVGLEEGEAGGGAWKGEELGGVGPLLVGAADGVALVEEGSDEPRADEAVGSCHAHRFRGL